MSKTILDHLIETTARLFAAHYQRPNGEYQHAGKRIIEARMEARAIVALWAGPPCGRPIFYVDHDSAYDPTPVDECENCGWPRSQHGGGDGEA